MYEITNEMVKDCLKIIEIRDNLVKEFEQRVKEEQELINKEIVEIKVKKFFFFSKKISVNVRRYKPTSNIFEYSHDKSSLSYEHREYIKEKFKNTFKVIEELACNIAFLNRHIIEIKNVINMYKKNKTIHFIQMEHVLEISKEQLDMLCDVLIFIEDNNLNRYSNEI